MSQRLRAARARRRRRVRDEAERRASLPVCARCGKPMQPIATPWSRQRFVYGCNCAPDTTLTRPFTLD